MIDRISKLKEFLEQSPRDSFLKHALALEYIRTGEEDRARQLFEEVLAHDPGYIGSYYQLGKLLERKAAVQQAREVYENGLKAAREAGDRHAYSELQNALEELDE